MGDAAKTARELIETRNKLEWLDEWFKTERERRIREGISGRIEIHVYFEDGRIPKIIINPTQILSDDTAQLSTLEVAESLAAAAGHPWQSLGPAERTTYTEIADGLGGSYGR